MVSRALLEKSCPGSAARVDERAAGAGRGAEDLPCGPDESVQPCRRLLAMSVQLQAASSRMPTVGGVVLTSDVSVGSPIARAS